MRKYIFMLLFVGTIVAPIYSAHYAQMWMLPFIALNNVCKAVHIKSTDAVAYVVRSCSSSTRSLSHVGADLATLGWRSLFNRFGFVTQPQVNACFNEVQKGISDLDTKITINCANVRAGQRASEFKFSSWQEEYMKRIQLCTDDLTNKVQQVNNEAQNVLRSSDDNKKLAMQLQERSSQHKKIAHTHYTRLRRSASRICWLKKRCALAEKRSKQQAGLIKEYQKNEQQLMAEAEEHRDQLRTIEEAVRLNSHSHNPGLANVLIPNNKYPRGLLLSLSQQKV